MASSSSLDLGKIVPPAGFLLRRRAPVPSAPVLRGRSARGRCGLAFSVSSSNGVIAATFVCPLDVIKTRFQVHGWPKLALARPEHEAPGSKSFFTEIIASISDIKFSMDGRHILSRDYMTLKLWDVNMDSGPVATFQVHEYLRPNLCDLYENDSIFDKFECCQSGDGLRVATGSYSNIFRVFNCGAGDGEVTTLEAIRNPAR